MTAVRVVVPRWPTPSAATSSSSQAALSACTSTPEPTQSPVGRAASRAAGLAMAFKLIESGQDRWRAVNTPHLVALVRAGATFIYGKLVERPGENTEPEAA